jgi:hypothetical protein
MGYTWIWLALTINVLITDLWLKRNNIGIYDLKLN